MKDPLKIGLTILAVIILGSLGIRVLAGAVSFLWGLVVPIAVVVAIALIIYGVFSRKALGGGRNSLP